MLTGMPTNRNKILVAGNNRYAKEVKSKLSSYPFKTYSYTGKLRDIEAEVTLCQPDAVIILGSDELIKREEDFFREFIADWSLPPVIVTGVKERESIQKALEVGADIIQNPLEKNMADIITLKVRNFFDTKEKFQKKNWLSLVNKTFNDSGLSDDEAFLKDIIELISANIDNYKFSVCDLAFAANLSERQLYRRVKSLTSYTPAALIREMRLQRAHKLVSDRQVKTKKELANKVGYKSVNHFFDAYYKRFKERPKLKSQVFSGM